MTQFPLESLAGRLARLMGETSQRRSRLHDRFLQQRETSLRQVQQLIERGSRLLRASVPRSERYGRAEWELFTSLVDNRELWKAVADHFDTDRDGA